MRIHHAGQTITLGKQEFVSAGGEGAVYAKGDLAFKVYHDAGRVIAEAKLRELGVLTLARIIKPLALITDDQRRPVGYVMPYLRNVQPLCQLFTRSFRDRNRITPAMVLTLVRLMREGVLHCHARRVLIVDLNEMNFLLDKTFGDVFFGDVDSYQTPSFPATAIMDSVRDRHASSFSEGSDWFSFAVVSFQMMVGIHPYKGTHPVVRNLDERMQRNLSVLNKDVSLPPACQPLSVVPPAWRAWYEDVLERGRRGVPPDDFTLGPAVLVAAKAPSYGDLVVKLLARYDSDILDVLDLGGATFVLTTGAVHHEHGRTPLPSREGAGGGGGFLIHDGRSVYAACLDHGRLAVTECLTGVTRTSQIEADALIPCDGFVVAVHGCMANEVSVVGGLPLITRSYEILEKATRLGDGCLVQSILGACYASLFPRPGVCWQIHVKELDGWQMVSARFHGGVLGIVGYKGGKYRRLFVRVSPDMPDSYDLWADEEAQGAGVELACLSSGVCVRACGDGFLEVFRARPGATDSKKVKAEALGGGARQYALGPRLACAAGSDLLLVSLRA
jgi:hypothetical protein